MMFVIAALKSLSFTKRYGCSKCTPLPRARLFNADVSEVRLIDLLCVLFLLLFLLYFVRGKMTPKNRSFLL